MKTLLKKPQIYFLILIFVSYLVLNFFISGFYKTLPLILVYAKTVNWFKLSISFFLSIAIGVLVSVTAVSTYVKYKERKNCAGGGALSGIGAVGGLTTGFCPLCITGLFPLILGLFGISFSFAALPFGGIEVQVFVVLILLASLKMLNKRN